MTSAMGIRPAWFLLVALLGCNSGPSGPSSGSLRLTILGLPSGSPAEVTVTGPGNFSQVVSASYTFSQLVPGTYSVVAAGVTAGTTLYDPSPPTQNISITASDAQATASILYTVATGNLAVTVNGLGTSRSATVAVTGPNGYNQPVDATTTLRKLVPGDYTVTAGDAATIGCASHTAAPATQSVSVVARSTATATVNYSAPADDGSGVNLCIAGLYVTQSAQDGGGTVPLVQGREGYLRVFVVADKSNTLAPQVQVRLYQGASLDRTINIPSSSLSVPTAVDESSLAYSWDTTLSGTTIQPGLAIQAEVNPGGLLPESNPGDNVYPAAGPLPLTVLSVPPLDVTFVPVLQAGSNQVGRVTAANQDSFLIQTQRMHPIDTFNVLLHAPYTTKTKLTLESDNTNGAWGVILGEIDALRVAEHSPRYYYGVARVTYSIGVAGVAYVSGSGTTAGSGQRAALGWDYLPSGSMVAAHELGHNWARTHAPCGGPAQVDPNYPRIDGTTGSYGMDVSAKKLEPDTLGDIMGYCDPKWISDYTYRGVMNYLRAPSPPILSSVANVQPCLLVWGHIRDGAIVLEPVFQVNTQPSLPERPGTFLLEGRDPDGGSVFSLSFSPKAVVDAPTPQENFVFAIPLSDPAAARLASVRVSGRGREAILTDSSASSISGPDPVIAAERLAGNRVAVRWDSRSHPMVMVRDPETGEVLSFARDGEVELATTKEQIDLLVSSGVRSQLKRLRVTP